MSTWAKMQQTIDELRAELTSVQSTTAKLDAALAERAEKARKYTSANGGVEVNLDTGEIKLSSLAMGSLPSDPQMITVTAGEWADSDVPANAKARLAFMMEQIDKVPAEYRADAEFSTEDISFDRDGSDIRTTLTYRRLETGQEAEERVARQSGHGVTINADGLTIMANGKFMVRLDRCMDDEQPAEQPFAVEGGQVFIHQSLIDRFATKAQINEEASARAAVDADLASRIGVLEARLCRGDDGDGALRDAFRDWKPGTALLAARGSTAIDRFAVRMAKTSNGKYVCSGIGLGNDPANGETANGLADRLQEIAKQIADSELGLELSSKIDTVEVVRDVIRKELRPGGLLHRR